MSDDKTVCSSRKPPSVIRRLFHLSFTDNDSCNRKHFWHTWSTLRSSIANDNDVPFFNVPAKASVASSSRIEYPCRSSKFLHFNPDILATAPSGARLPLIQQVDLFYGLDRIKVESHLDLLSISGASARFSATVFPVTVSISV